MGSGEQKSLGRRGGGGGTKRQNPNALKNKNKIKKRGGGGDYNSTCCNGLMQKEGTGNVELVQTHLKSGKNKGKF